MIARANTGATAIGLAAVVVGIGYVAAGGSLVCRGDTALDAWAGGADVLQPVAGYFSLVGIALLAQGVLGVASGMALLVRRPWGRVVILVLSVPSVLLGLLFLTAAHGNVMPIALGVVQVVYSALTWLVLVRRGADFQ